jgi:hypothetical protein
MNGYSAFGWMVVREADYRELMKEREEAISRWKTHEDYIPIVQESYRAAKAELAASREGHDRDLKSLTEAMVKAEGDLKKSREELVLKTAECKQMRDDLIQTRKMLWNIPDSLPRDVAEQVDWERCGLPVPDGLGK